MRHRTASRCTHLLTATKLRSCATRFASRPGWRRASARLTPSSRQGCRLHREPPDPRRAAPTPAPSLLRIVGVHIFPWGRGLGCSRLAALVRHSAAEQSFQLKAMLLRHLLRCGDRFPRDASLTCCPRNRQQLKRIDEHGALVLTAANGIAIRVRREPPSPRHIPLQPSES